MNSLNISRRLSANLVVVRRLCGMTVDRKLEVATHRSRSAQVVLRHHWAAINSTYVPLRAHTPRPPRYAPSFVSTSPDAGSFIRFEREREQRCVTVWSLPANTATGPVAEPCPCSAPHPVDSAPSPPATAPPPPDTVGRWWPHPCPTWSRRCALGRRWRGDAPSRLRHLDTGNR